MKDAGRGAGLDFRPRESTLRLAHLYIYPVKAMAGPALAGSRVEPWGLEGDRRWMLVDGRGRFLSQRTHPRLAVLRAVPSAGGIVLDGAGQPPLAVPYPREGSATLQATIWRDTVPATLACQSAHDWLSAALDEDVRLVHMHDPLVRRVNPAFGRPGESTSFADGYPVLLTSLASLADLNRRLANPVPIGRFRPNLVVDGAAAWAEDSWRTVRIGEAVFRVVKPCDRCIVTTIDQDTGTRPDRMEPLRTLGRFRQDERGIMFGQNLIPVVPGRVAEGDEVAVLEAGEPNFTPLMEAC